MGKLVDNLLRHLKRDYKQLIGGVFAIFSIVILLIVIFYLTPKEVQSSLILERNKPNLLTMWSNHFIHFDETHLWGNIKGFLISSTFLLIVLFFTKNIKLFHKLLILNLTIIPILLSLAWLFIFTKEGLRIAGFSGVIGSFLSSSILLYLFRVTNIFGIRLNIALSSSWVGCSFILILLLTYYPAYQIIYLSMFILGTFLFTLYTLKTIKIEDKRRKLRKQKLSTHLLILSLLLAVPVLTLLLSAPLFPPLSVFKERPIGIGVHFIGIVAGLVVVCFIESGWSKHFQEIKEKCHKE